MFIPDRTRPVVVKISENQTSGGQLSVVKEVPPTDSTKSNSSLVITYDASNNPITLEKTINGVTYTKTLTYTDGNLTDISSWVQL